MAVSCCKDEQSSIHFAWSYEMPRLSSPYIYWYGAKIMPLYGTTIVTHTTLYDDVGISDNRLCGFDISKRQIEWIYPEDIDKRQNIVFDNLGYQVQDIFVVKYVETLVDGTHMTHVSGVDIKTGQEKWIFSESTIDLATFCPDIVGDGDYCFFVNDGKRVYRTNINNGETRLFYSDDRLSIANSPLLLDNNQVGLVLYDYFGDSKEEKIILINADTNEIESTFYLPKYDSLSGRSAKVINDRDSFYCSIAHYICSINSKTGAIEWETWTPGYDDANNMLVEQGVLIKAGLSATIVIDAKTGESIYQFPNLGADLISIYGDLVLYITSYGSLLLMSLEDGNIIQEVKCPDKGEYFFGSFPVVYDKNLYIMGITKLYCFDIN